MNHFRHGALIFRTCPAPGHLRYMTPDKRQKAGVNGALTRAARSDSGRADAGLRKF